MTDPLIQEQLQKILNKKVNVDMIHGLKAGIKERIKNEMLAKWGQATIVSNFKIQLIL